MHKGIDVSSFQGSVDFQKVHDAGNRFVMIKLTEGATLVDRAALGHQRAARKANLHSGFYHFLHPQSGRRGRVEAEFFYKHAEGVKGAQHGAELLRLALDIELTHFVGRGKTAEARFRDMSERTLDYAHDAATRLQEIAHHTPQIYTFPAFLPNWSERFAEFPLWIAHPGVRRPTLPLPWREYTIWQNSFRGRVDGVHGLVDTDVCPELSRLMLERDHY